MPTEFERKLNDMRNSWVCEAFHEIVAAHFAAIAALEAERDALRADAERYRWLREQDDSGEIFCMYGSNGAWGECGHMEIYGDLLDSEIDGYIAAIAAKEPK